MTHYEWEAAYCGGNLWTQGQHLSVKSLQVANDTTSQLWTGRPSSPSALSECFLLCFLMLFLRLFGPLFSLGLQPPSSGNRITSTFAQSTFYKDNSLGFMWLCSNWSQSHFMDEENWFSPVRHASITSEPSNVNWLKFPCHCCRCKPQRKNQIISKHHPQNRLSLIFAKNV